MKTILQPNDVIHYTGISEHFPTCDLRTIMQIEYAEFRTCLGLGFYETLKNDLVNYNAAEFDPNTTYSEGSTVQWYGIVYKALQESTQFTPDNTEYWELAPKFNQSYYQDLWCMFLAPFLSWQLIRSRLPFIWRQVKAEGIVKIFGNTFESAGIKEFQVLHAAVAKEADMTFDNMDSYMKSASHTYFNTYIKIGKACCGECGHLPDKCTCRKEEQCSRKNTGYGYHFG